MQFTLGEFIDAMEKNGLPQGIGHTFSDYENVKSGDSCAIGQAYWNLHGQPNEIDPNNETDFWDSLDSSINAAGIPDMGCSNFTHYADRRFMMLVTHLNDATSHHWPIDKIVGYLRTQYSAFLDIILEA